MAKNIVVFSDGTGQDGGVRPEQRLSNVYKLYRVCRVGPDSGIDPREQVAFYDAGLGTDVGATALTSPVRFVQKLLASVTGRGVTTNIAECYEFIVNHHRPGDRIFLVGFSRGAYTVRAVADLIRLCGVPTRTPAGPLPLFRKAVRDIADESVLTVLEHGAGHRREAFEDEREELARRFRDKYGSHYESGEERRSNVAPYFIGVFDTVASLGASGLRRRAIQALVAIGAALVLALAAALPSAVLAGVLGTFFDLPFWSTFWASVAAAVVVGGLTLWFRQRGFYTKTIHNFPNVGDVRSHSAEWKGEYFNRLLSRWVMFARSANAIDETRADFDRLHWGPSIKMEPKVIDGHERFVQMWFAGNHSDIGGSYPEPESRLSDIALQWMMEEATRIPHGLKVDGAKALGDATGNPKLRLFPAADGVQHCEVNGMRDALERSVPRFLRRFTAGLGWKVQIREIDPQAETHPAVAKRFELPSVVQCGGIGPYRPIALAGHERFKEYQADTIEALPWQSSDPSTKT